MTEPTAFYRGGSETVIGLYDDAFLRTIRTNRSEAYKKGVFAGLKKGIDRVAFASPYMEGSAEDDAFFAGVDEGLKRAQNHLTLTLEKSTTVEGG